MVSVAVMATLAALTPPAAQMPLPSTALGMAVKRMALSGRGTSTWESTERYTLGICSGRMAANFLAVK